MKVRSHSYFVLSPSLFPLRTSMLFTHRYSPLFCTRSLPISPSSVSSTPTPLPPYLRFAGGVRSLRDESAAIDHVTLFPGRLIIDCCRLWVRLLGGRKRDNEGRRESEGKENDGEGEGKSWTVGKKRNGVLCVEDKISIKIKKKRIKEWNYTYEYNVIT